MDPKEYDKDAYFELRDKLIKRLPEPEKSVFSYFRMMEKMNMEKYGKLIVHGVSPLDKTAEHFMMDVDETKEICLYALKQINEMMNMERYDS